MDDIDKKDMDDAINAISSMISRSEKVKEKFAQGTSQHTLQKNRLNALNIALSLIKRELDANGSTEDYSKEDLKNAVAPIASLISKSEKAQSKLKHDSWQYIMLDANLKALGIASPLLAKALEEK